MGERHGSWVNPLGGPASAHILRCHQVTVFKGWTLAGGDSEFHPRAKAGLLIALCHREPRCGLPPAGCRELRRQLDVDATGAFVAL